MIVKTILITTFLLCFSSTVFSARPGEDQDKVAEKKVAQKIEKKTGQKIESSAQALVNRLSLISSLEGNFQQSVIDESGESLQETKGTYKLQRPGFLDWNTAPPFEQRVISNGDKLWVYDPDLEQVTIYNQEKIQDGPANILNGNLEQIKTNYHVEYDSVGHLKKTGQTKVKDEIKHSEAMSKKGLRRFVLTPKDQENGSFSEVALVFTDKAIQKISMLDKLGQQTIIRFSETKLNTPMSESDFLFTPPAETDIVFDGAP